ncbi:MAG TPA: cupin domain-containing protein [Spirochaetota bacterium]|nr:cupin domain-containing protein [Spirochaetota bacterium]
MIGRHTSDKYIQILDGIRIKTLVHGESTLMAEFQLSRGSILPAHSHPYEQTGYLVSGCISLFIGGMDFAMKPGDSWCIPAGEDHRAEVHEDSVALEIFSPPRGDYMKYCNNADIIKNDI